MRLDGRRRSDNYEDRGRSTGGSGGGGGIPIRLLISIFRLLGRKGSLIALVLLVGGYLLAPERVWHALLDGGSAGNACDVNAAACDFSRAILASNSSM